MTTTQLNSLVATAANMSTEDKKSVIKLSDYSTLYGYEHVMVKENGEFKYKYAFHLNMFENIFDCFGRLIGNRIN